MLKRIIFKLSHERIRAVARQYLAGYKDVGSIEKSRNKDMKNLSKQIEMLYPLQ